MIYMRQTNAEIMRLDELFANADLSFDHFDDVVIRRLVECIRVMKDGRIVVTLKGGLHAEEYI